MACYISATRLPKYSLCSKLDSDKGVHPAIWSEVWEFILGCLISRTPLMTMGKLGEPEGTSRTRTISLKVAGIMELDKVSGRFVLGFIRIRICRTCVGEVLIWFYEIIFSQFKVIFMLIAFCYRNAQRN
ncbi:uncharacterized protein [Triticum aestivum]|uniref:uncharacterized protein n=1 Tax=Triticum aestivum TaxID=4565 RepID=UPI001D003379|nr:uncharacterized protein LOC123128625 [Triticum aestivum]XP_044404614.1 uncharacterized protein LOC123128625 [Triticum aestivum]